MLSCFNLKRGISLEEFSRSLTELDQYLRSQDLVRSTGEVGKRVRHPVMDTDSERHHQYFVIMSFTDRAQCDRSVDFVNSATEPCQSLHRQVWRKVADPVFICWEEESAG